MNTSNVYFGQINQLLDSYPGSKDPDDDLKRIRLLLQKQFKSFSKQELVSLKDKMINVKVNDELIEFAKELIGKKATRIFAKYIEDNIANLTLHELGVLSTENPESAGLKMIKFESEFYQNFQLIPFFKVFSHIEELILVSCSALTNDFFVEVAPCLVSLKGLHLINCNFTNLDAISDNCKNLEGINLASSLELDAQTIVSFVSHYPGLKKLNVDYANLSTSELSTISEKCPQLEEISLSHNTQLKGEEFAKAFARFSKMKNLSLSHTLVDDDVLKGIAASCKDLEKIDLSGCNKVTQKGKDLFPKSVQII